MSEFRVLSIDLTALGEFVRANPNHSAITVSQSNGKKYLSLLIGDKDAPDQYGNDCSARINPKKDAGDGDIKPYLGNGRIFGRGQRAASPQAAAASPQAAPSTPQPVDDLPF